ncbi:MAG: GtrA family protein [Pseudomonadota bacterium]
MTVERTRNVWQKAIRFGLVGLLNTLIDVATFALLIALSFPALAANVGAWLVAISASYMMNSRWSFERDQQLREGWSILRFVGLGALVSLGISSGAILALAPVIGLWPAKILGVAAAAVLNFIAARWSIENRLR